MVSGYYIFMDEMSEGRKIAGLVTGVYTGGTPNMAAVKTALNVDSGVYIMTHTYDMFVCAIFLLFTMTFFKQFTGLFLKPFTIKNEHKVLNGNSDSTEELESYKGIFKDGNYKGILKGLGLSIVILVVSWGGSQLVSEEFATVTAILVLTSLGILFSAVPTINRTPKTYQSGMYLILIFSLAVSSMADLEALEDVSHQLFFYVLYVVAGITILNFVFSYIFKIDKDTTLITLTALIFSPPFVPLVASKLKNKAIIISGITVVIIGYSVGTFLGIFSAYLLK